MLARIHDRLGLRTSPTLFFGSLGITVLFVALTLLFTDAVNETFSKVSGWIITNLGWFYISGVTIFPSGPLTCRPMAALYLVPK